VSLFIASAAITIDAPEDATPAVAFELAGTRALSAQANGNGGGGGGVTCGWCDQQNFWNANTGQFVMHHKFPNGGDECGWANGNGAGGGGGNDICARCSDCHDDYEPGNCHIECGPGAGDLAAAALHDLDESIRRADARGIARVLRTLDWMRYSPDSFSVRIAAPCGGHGRPSIRKIPARIAVQVAAFLSDGDEAKDRASLVSNSAFVTSGPALSVSNANTGPDTDGHDG
jgi:hypothetical protein